MKWRRRRVSLWHPGGKKRKNQPFTEPAVTPRMIDRDRKM